MLVTYPDRRNLSASPDGTYATLHPISGSAPDQWQCTRSVAVHPIRRGAMPTDRVQRPNQQEQTRHLQVNR